MPVGVLVANESGMIVFGYTPYGPDGRVRQPGEVAVGRALHGEAVEDEEDQLVWPDGTRTIVSTHAAPILVRAVAGIGRREGRGANA
jgi:hypothetical protein